MPRVSRSCPASSTATITWPLTATRWPSAGGSTSRAARRISERPRWRGKSSNRATRPCATPVGSTNSPWFNELQLRVAHTGTLSALSITVLVQRTPGVGYSGMYNTVGGQVTQTNSSTTSAITYQFTLAAGQTLGPSSNRLFAAQMGGSGTIHPTTGDTYTVTYTTGGVTFTQTGNF